jgi:hypothetical protein
MILTERPPMTDEPVGGKAKDAAIVNGRWTNGTFLKGAWEWDGFVCEHQTQGDWGEVHPHHFFGDIDLSRIRGCYRQMLAKPGAEHFERFYQMWPMDGARGFGRMKDEERQPGGDNIFSRLASK